MRDKFSFTLVKQEEGPFITDSPLDVNKGLHKTFA